MSGNEIPNEVKDFVFQYIDSVEQLEILLLLNSVGPKREWSVDEIAQHLRSSRNSVEKRLQVLKYQGLIDERTDGGKQHYCRLQDEGLQKHIDSLAEIYKVHRHSVMEIIFSPMKKGRDFAEAFKLSGGKDSKGGQNG